MPSFVSGNSSCTAWASTCAVECRRMARPSGLSMPTGCTRSPSASGQARSLSSPLILAAIAAPAMESPLMLVLSLPLAVSSSACPAVVPASTTCSRPARVMCSLSAGTGMLLGRKRVPAAAAAGTPNAIDAQPGLRPCYR